MGAWSCTLSAEDVNSADFGVSVLPIRPPLRCPECGGDQVMTGWITRDEDATVNEDGSRTWHFPHGRRDPDYVRCSGCGHTEKTAEPFEEAGRKAMQALAEANESEYCSECGQEL